MKDLYDLLSLKQTKKYIPQECPWKLWERWQMTLIRAGVVCLSLYLQGELKFGGFLIETIF